MGDYGSAMAYSEQALSVQSERGGTSKILNYCCSMGDVLVAQEGREKDAIVMFQKGVGSLEEGNASRALMQVFLQLGQAYRSIGAWDDAIAYLEKGLSIAESIEDEFLGNHWNFVGKQVMGKVYLEMFYSTDESLDGIPERNDEVIGKALFWSEAALQHWTSNGKMEPVCSLDLAQEHYFLGDSEKAHVALKKYLEGTMQLGASHCQACEQICAKDAIMEKCSVCKVARYCSEAHSIQAWKKGRLCHKVMCPWLKRWRKIKPGKELLLICAMNSAMTFSDVSLLPIRSDAFGWQFSLLKVGRYL